MDQIYDKASDKNVAATKVYTKSSDNYAYSDSACTKKIPEAELAELFVKGAIIIAGTITYKPVSYSVTSGVGAMTYVKANTTTAATAVLTLLYSKEYSST